MPNRRTLRPMETAAPRASELMARIVEPVDSFSSRIPAPRECILHPNGELTAATMASLRSAIAAGLSRGARRIVVDVSDVGVINGSAREGLVICTRAAHAGHAELVVIPPLTLSPPRLVETVGRGGASTETG